jgi:hypothetical protein
VDAGWRRWPVEACLRWAAVAAALETAMGLDLRMDLGRDLGVGREPAAGVAQAVVEARVLRLPM